MLYWPVACYGYCCTFAHLRIQIAEQAAGHLPLLVLHVPWPAAAPPKTAIAAAQLAALLLMLLMLLPCCSTQQ
jgi:hypothetical protein